MPKTQSPASTIVILGTGGTIAGTAADASDLVGYTAGQVGVAQLAAEVPALRDLPIEFEQVAQLDSKDMDFATWQRLAQRVAAQLARDEVQGIVITHGTDTLEETAYFLQRVLAPSKPVVMTAAMRPSTALSADGPQNMRDAVSVAQSRGARGVSVVVAGSAWHPFEVRKTHTYRLDAFDAGDAGPIARIEQDRVRMLRDWPLGDALGVTAIEREPARWPRVEIVMNHAGADGRIVEALVALGVDGLVVAGTGNGTVSAALTQALQLAQAHGVRVLRTSRCARGPVIATAHDAMPASEALSPVQARVELILELLAK